ncbi:MAG: YihY/virulence factor BrkB family protein [Cyclobacteriaceae bacterium]
MTSEQKNETKFSIKDLPSLVVETAKAWNKDDPWRLSAIVAYYAVLSLPGLLVIIIQLVGYIWGVELVEGKVYNEIKSSMGESAADSMQSIFKNANEDDRSIIATIIGIATLIFGATGVFYHLQLSINNIWQIVTTPKSNFLKLLFDRARSFAFVLVVGFLLLTSFVISTALSAMQEYINLWFPGISIYVARLVDLGLSLSVITVLFALIFKFLPDAHIRWKSVWIGAFLTSCLFILGKLILGFYFGQANPGSIYGAAGSMVIIMLWVSYSCLILFFGAEFTWIYTRKYGYGIKAKKYSKIVSEETEMESDL